MPAREQKVLYRNCAVCCTALEPVPHPNGETVTVERKCSGCGRKWTMKLWHNPANPMDNDKYGTVYTEKRQGF